MSEVSAKKQVKNSMKPTILAIAIMSPFIIITGIFLYYLTIHPLIQKSMNVEQLLCDRLNTWNENSDKSGITAIRSAESGVYEMWYNFNPIGYADTDSELATTIAKNLIKTFMDKNELNYLTVTVCRPYRDAYLNVVWKPYISFKLNRETLAKYSYEKFQSSDLYIVADNIKYYE